MTTQVITLEGNTNQAASRTGGQVARLRRTIGHKDPAGYTIGFGMPRYPTSHGPAIFATKMRHDLGYTEGADNDNKFGREFGMNHEPWCAICLSVEGLHAFGTKNVCGWFSYTPSWADWFKKLDRWSTVPHVGAFGFVYYPSMRRIGHVYFVESIVGAAPAPTSGRVTPYRRHHTSVLRLGSHGSDVVDAQILLNNAGAHPQLVKDGAFGAKTQTEVRDFQSHHRLNPDGVIGARTWPVLEREGA